MGPDRYGGSDALERVRITVADSGDPIQFENGEIMMLSDVYSRVESTLPRRAFLRSVFGAGVLGCTLLKSHPFSAAQVKRRTNVILVVTDDQAYGDLALSPCIVFNLRLQQSNYDVKGLMLDEQKRVLAGIGLDVEKCFSFTSRNDLCG